MNVDTRGLDQIQVNQLMRTAEQMRHANSAVGEAAMPSADSRQMDRDHCAKQENRTTAGHRQTFGLGGPFTESLTLENVDDAMRYMAWAQDQLDAGDIVREALTAAAKAILRVVPAGAFRSVALRKVVEARMDANAAISFRGRF